VGTKGTKLAESAAVECSAEMESSQDKHVAARRAMSWRWRVLYRK
jgi:hypothetical protein